MIHKLLSPPFLKGEIESLFRNLLSFTEIRKMPEHTARQGDCIYSIAERYGFFWETIWNHPNNAELKQQRGDPSILYPGDVVFVPEREEKQESGATEQRHRFRRKGVPLMLRLRLMLSDETSAEDEDQAEDEPRANESYTLDIDGNLFSGTTDGDGWLEHPIPPGAQRGRLIIDETQEEYQLNFGHVDPIDDVSGVQARLNNLGFECGEADGAMNDQTEMALRQFQRKYGITESGEADQETRDRLLELYGS